ncbi:MAG: hypothetical protein OXU51_16920 [Candidatus Poribacteria bacterium]|nr:hypothetical protein [Candidatus Poribacteria bacterium]
MKLEKSWTQVVLDPQIFPVTIVLNAAYMLLNKFSFRIEGDPESAIVVRLRSIDSHPTEDLEYILNKALMRASINAYQMARTAEVRHYFLKASLSFEESNHGFESVLKQRESECLLEPVKYTVGTDLSGKLIRISVDIGKNHPNRLLLPLFYIAEKLTDDCWMVIRRVKDGHIIGEAKPKCGTLEVVTLRLEEELIQLSDQSLPCGIIQSPVDIY